MTIQHVSQRPILGDGNTNNGLHGRTRESFELKNAICRVLDAARNGEQQRELILISGDSGTGKSSLARAVTNDLMGSGAGLFIEGKFDQFQHSQAFAAAFAQIVPAKSQERAVVERKIKDAVGADLKLLVEIIPALADFLDLPMQQQAPPGAADGNNNNSAGIEKTKTRAARTLCKFVGAICSPSNPIMLFLDDLQWSDSTSFEWLGELLRDKRIGGLVLIGACRIVPHDHELSIFLRVLDEEPSTDIRITSIVVANVSEHTTTCFLSELLQVTQEECESLARVVYAQTEGNFFFTKQLVQSLQEENLLVYRRDAVDVMGGWTWDEDEVTSHYSSHDVLQFMTRKLRLLSPEIQGSLRLASCLGASFRESVMSTLLQNESSGQVEDILEVCQEKGLLAMLSSNDGGRRTWSFVHDRIQQAAYCLIPLDGAVAFHLAIGRKLRDNLNSSELEDCLLLVANQLRIGCIQMTSTRERIATAAFCLRAGQRSCNTSRFKEADKYLKVGLSLLDTNHWKNNYELSLNLYNASAEIAYVMADFDRLDDLTDTVVKQARSFDDMLQSFTTHVFSLGTRNMLQEAITEGIMVLEKLGEPLPQSASKTLSVVEFYKTQIALSRLSECGLLDLSPMTNLKKLAAMRLMNLLYSYTFWSGDARAAIITYRSVQMTMKYGLSGMSAVGLAFYAGYLCSFGKIDQGYRIGQIALIILDRFKATEWTGRVVTTIHSFVFPWKDSPCSLAGPLRSAYHAGLDSGDIEFALMAKGVLINHQFISGFELQPIATNWLDLYAEILKFKQEALFFLFAPGMQATANLLGEAQDQLVLTGHFMNEEKSMEQGVQDGNHLTICLLLLFKCVIQLIMGEFGKANKSVMLLKKQPKQHTLAPFMEILEAYLCGLVPLTEGRPKIRQAKRYLRKLQKHIIFSPKTTLSKVYLLEAEIFAVSGKPRLAVPKYESAIGLTKREDLRFEEALICERAYLCMKKCGNADEAASYLAQAKDAYSRWGCTSKVLQLNATKANEVDRGA